MSTYPTEFYEVLIQALTIALIQNCFFKQNKYIARTAANDATSV